MRSVSPAVQQALLSRQFNIRDLIWFVVRDRVTGAEVRQGYWSDVTAENLEIVNPRNQAVETRRFDGAGNLISVGPIPLVSNLTIQTVNVGLSQIGDANRLIRTYDARQARVEIFRGYFEPNSLVQIAPATPRFLGFVDAIEFKTPPEGGSGSIDLTLASHTQELTRSNPAKRSDTYQRLRAGSDSFRQHVAVVGTWEQRWGASS